MNYTVLVKHPQYLVWQDQKSNELLFTGLLGDIAMAPKTVVMNPEEIEGFKKGGDDFLADLRMQMEIEYDSGLWQPRFIQDFDKDPERRAIILERTVIPASKSSNFWSRLFGGE